MKMTADARFVDHFEPVRIRQAGRRESETS